MKVKLDLLHNEDWAWSSYLCLCSGTELWVLMALSKNSLQLSTFGDLTENYDCAHCVDILGHNKIFCQEHTYSQDTLKINEY